MKVWRIECPHSRNGPWTGPRPNKGVTILEVGNHAPYRGPDATCDCKLGWEEMTAHKCAVKDHDQLRRWFYPQHLHLLADAGYVLAEYEVPDDQVHEGDWQLAVNKSALQHLADHSPLEAIPHA